jgi:hypothetical protein
LTAICVTAWHWQPLLISHWPELASFVSQLKLSPGNQAGMRYNAGTLVKMMEELQLPWTLQVLLLLPVQVWQVGTYGCAEQTVYCWRTVCSACCCAVLCCAVLCCAVLCCAVLCCAVLCCAMLLHKKDCCDILCDIDVLCMLSTGGGDHQTRLKRYGAAGALLVPDHTPAPP